jgi:predicted MPP superfamily phosphohydrolase
MDFEKLLWSIKECGEYHFTVITGDLVTGWPVSLENQEKIDRLLKTLSPKIETLMVLGNHDSLKMVPYLEQKGIKVLTNQLLAYNKTGTLPFSFEIIGTDDPHYFFQKDALRIMQEGQKEKFRLALVHSPELYDVASKNHIDLYLCGHTHGGQVALPGGFAPLRRVYRGKKYYRGAWSHNEMAGYTSSGIGTSGLPIRFNTQAEMVLHHIGGMKT